DLYAEGFDPVLSRHERERYLGDCASNVAAVAPHVEALNWAEALVFVFPIWFYGPPAMLKGWLERVWLPGVAFEIPRYKGDRARGKLHNIRKLVVITSSGSPWWWLKLIRDPARNLFARGLRVLFARSCHVEWLQLYNMNNASDDDRRRFVARVERRLGALCQAG
ncbi:MAG: flavodoxin family protein, partial [Alphaproteobacteria bacterium]|nr:flavodoxin family protein [Alphaproteobacteria bacterium]